MRRPLLLEGEAGVGKTEVGKTLARLRGAELVRLQCYEGIDASQALYEWDYARQLLQIRALSAVALAEGGLGAVHRISQSLIAGADDAPALLCVDAAHWAGEQSLPGVGGVGAAGTATAAPATARSTPPARRSASR